MFLTVAAACLGLVASSVPAARPAPPPSNTALPVITGTAQAGQTLRVSTGSWSPPASSYQYAWQRCNSSGNACQNSPTSTSSSSYTLTAGDVGYRIVAQVAPDGLWNRAASSLPTALVAVAPPGQPVNTVRPVISGTTQAGQTLQVSSGTWSPVPSSLLYAWHRCNSAGANCLLSPTSSSSPSYLLTSGDVGYTIVAQVAPNGLWGSSVNSAPSAVVVGSAPTGTPLNSVRPVISGTAQVGQWLSVSNGTWSPAPSSYAYAWHRCNSAGTSCSLSPSSGSSSSYLVGSGDVGFTIVAQVAPNGLWGSSVNSAPSSVVVGSAPAPTGTPVNSVRPVISGTAQVGQWLSVSNGTWSPAPSSYAYAWHRCNSAGTSCSLSPSSGSSSSYLVGSGDVGFTIVAQVAPNGLWGSSVNSAPSSVVVGSAPAPTGSPVNSVRPVISGTAQVGQWLSVSNGTWSPAPSSYAYAWHRCNSAGTSCSLSPSSGSSSSYLVGSGDVGYTIVAQVAPNGLWGSSVNSAPSSVVVGSAPAPSGSPVNTVRPALVGTAQVGQWLSVSNGTWSPAASSYAYAWHRCNSAGTSCSQSPSSSNSSSYLVGSGDVGFTIVAQVAPNGLWGSSATSLPSAVVAGSAPSGSPVNTVRPALVGTAQVGQWLSVSNGTWSPAASSYAYAWHRCSSAGTNCSQSPSSTNSSSYLVGSGDVGYSMVAQVAPNGVWGSSATSLPSTVVSGTAALSTGTVPGTGLYRLGPSWGTGTNYNRFAYSFSGRDHAVQSAQLAGTALVYMAGVDISTQFSTGVDYTTAFNNGWLLKDAAGNYMTGYGSYLGDVGSAAYQQRWADNVGNFLAQTGANGVYIDDVLSNISTWSDCGCFPAKYPSQAAWQNAMVSWVASIGPALKARGFQVVASAHAFIPGDLRSNDGSLEVAWWRQLAPYLTGLSTEYWSQNPANPSQIRTTGGQWYQQWDNWQQLVSVAQNAGVDFFGLTYSGASTPGLSRYARGSFLLDWHGRGGAVSIEPKDGSDPWNPAATTDIGLPAGSKAQIAPGVWQRQYSAGIVVVNSNGYAVTVTVAGTARTIAATDALLTP